MTEVLLNNDLRQDDTVTFLDIFELSLPDGTLPDFYAPTLNSISPSNYSGSPETRIGRIHNDFIFPPAPIDGMHGIEGISEGMFPSVSHKAYEIVDSFPQQSNSSMSGFNFQGYDDFFSAPDHSAFYQAHEDYLPSLPGAKFPQQNMIIPSDSHQNFTPSTSTVVSTRMPVKVKKAKKVKDESSNLTLPCPEPGCEKV
jgi:hypothetical protein